MAQGNLFGESSEAERLSLDRELRAQGYSHIAGVDEAGRGPLAGPVVAAVAVVQPDIPLPGLDDSKKLTPLRREKLFERLHSLRGNGVAFGVGRSEAEEIDAMGILPATFQAMRRALDELRESADLDLTPYLLVVDGRDTVPDLEGIQQIAVVRGDGRSRSVAAASVLAKVARDRTMVNHAEDYPGYAFERHKGYGTRQHLDALESMGACPIHRRSFEPIRSMTVGESKP